MALYDQNDILDRAMATPWYFQIKSLLAGLPAKRMPEENFCKWLSERTEIFGQYVEENPANFTQISAMAISIVGECIDRLQILGYSGEQEDYVGLPEEDDPDD